LALASKLGGRFGGTVFRRFCEIGDSREIGTSAERTPRAVEVHNGSIGLTHGCFECVECGGRESVTAFWTVERHCANIAVVCRSYHGFRSSGVSKGLCLSQINLQAMEEAAAVRRTARATVEDIEPTRLRDDLLAFIDNISISPGVLTLLTARASTGSSDGLEQRAAGVQLIYNGLRLTRQLAHEEPWESGERASADIHVLAADVLVARGFYLLSRTDAAATAVEVVREFGRDQTNRRACDESLDTKLERDVIDLALATGTSAGDGDVTADLCAVADDLETTSEGDFPEPETFFDESVTERLTQSVAEVRADS
jgi:hypothetical protein